MSDQQKYEILSNELIRRLSNLDEKIAIEERLQIVEVLIREMKSSGYDRRFTREVITSGLIGLQRKIERRKKAGLNFFRTARSTLKGREKKKLMQKTNWYKSGGENKDEPTMKMGKRAGNMEKMPKKWKKGSTAKAVMFIPYTHGSLLAKKLREQETDMEKLTGYRLKVVERAGTKLENILPITNP